MNELTGNLIADLQYRVFEQDANSTIEDQGKIDYEIPLTSGTGISQVNQLYHNDLIHSVSGIAAIDMSGISFYRAGYQAVQSFVGAGGGSIKGTYVQNNSANDLGIRFPWHNSFVTVPPSASRFSASQFGWSIPASGYFLQTSGNGSIQNYTIALLGSINDKVIKPSFDVKAEYSQGLAPTGVSQLEYKIGVSGIAISSQLEWITTFPSAAITGHLEFLSSPLITVTGCYEYQQGVKRNNGIRYEYLGQSGVHIPAFNTAFELVESGNISNSSVHAYAYWYNEWDYHGYYMAWNGDHNTVQDNTSFQDNFEIQEIDGNRVIQIGRSVPNEVKIYQNMNLISGSAYYIRFDMFDTYSVLDYQGDLCHIRFKRLSNGNIIEDFQQYSPMANSNSREEEVFFYFRAPESGVRIEMFVPERTSWLTEDDGMSLEMRLKKYYNYLSIYDLEIGLSGTYPDGR